MSEEKLAANLILSNIADVVDVAGEKDFRNKMAYGDSNLKAIVFSFSPGNGLAEHAAPKPAILHFLEGSADVTVGDEAFVATAGTWVHMPATLPHSIKAIEPTKMMLMILLNG